MLELMKSVLQTHTELWESGEGNVLRKYNMMVVKKMPFNKNTTNTSDRLSERIGCVQRKQYFRVFSFSAYKPGALGLPVNAVWGLYKFNH